MHIYIYYSQVALPPGPPHPGGLRPPGPCILGGCASQTPCMYGTAPGNPSTWWLRPQTPAVALLHVYNVLCFSIRQ